MSFASRFLSRIPKPMRPIVGVGVSGAALYSGHHWMMKRRKENVRVLAGEQQKQQMILQDFRKLVQTIKSELPEPQQEDTCRKVVNLWQESFPNTSPSQVVVKCHSDGNDSKNEPNDVSRRRQQQGHHGLLLMLETKEIHDLFLQDILTIKERVGSDHREANEEAEEEECLEVVLDGLLEAIQKLVKVLESSSSTSNSDVGEMEKILLSLAQACHDSLGRLIEILEEDEEEEQSDGGSWWMSVLESWWIVLAPWRKLVLVEVAATALSVQVKLLQERLKEVPEELSPSQCSSAVVEIDIELIS